jgi:exopolysaccharide biosynthesis polyprenyl glycosylphosphotransferase
MRYMPLVRSESDSPIGKGRTGGLSTQSRRVLLYVQLLILDVTALLVASTVVTFGFNQNDVLWLSYYPMLAVCAAYVVSALNNGCYSVAALRSGGESTRLALSALLPAIFLVTLVAFLFKGSEQISRVGFATSLLLGTFMLVSGRILFSFHARRAMRGKFLEKLVIVDGNPMRDWRDASAVIEADYAGIVPNLGDPKMLDRFGCIAMGFDQVVIDAVPERHRDWALLLKGANVDGEIVVAEHDRLGAIGVGTAAGGHPSILVSRRPLRLHDRIRKRCFDLALTIPIIFALMPVLVIVAILIKLDSPGPILFKQDRIGRGNRLFKVLKFRSMRVEGSDPRGMRSTARNDDRITRVGKIIRATSIDELPQLFNVLLGSMSLVGPRPHPIGSLAEGRLFWDIDVTYWHRHQLKPGITGLAQVRGFRGATHQLSDLTDRLQADMEYIQDWNLWRDLQILISTARVVVHHNAF